MLWLKVPLRFSDVEISNSGKCKHSYKVHWHKSTKVEYLGGTHGGRWPTASAWPCRGGRSRGRQAAGRSWRRWARWRPAWSGTWWGRRSTAAETCRGDSAVIATTSHPLEAIRSLEQYCKGFDKMKAKQREEGLEYLFKEENSSQSVLESRRTFMEGLEDFPQGFSWLSYSGLWAGWEYEPKHGRPVNSDT